MVKDGGSRTCEIVKLWLTQDVGESCFKRILLVHDLHGIHESTGNGNEGGREGERGG